MVNTRSRKAIYSEDQKISAAEAKTPGQNTKKARKEHSSKTSNVETISTTCAVGLNSPLFDLRGARKQNKIAERKGVPEHQELFVKPHTPNKEDQSSSFEEVVEEDESKNDYDEEYADSEGSNVLEGGTEVEEGLAILGIARQDITNFVRPVCTPQMPVIQTAPPPPSKDEEASNQFVQRIGLLLPQQCLQHPALFVKITQTCFHEFMRTVSEICDRSKPDMV